MNNSSKAKALFVLLAACLWWLLAGSAYGGISIRGGLTHERTVRPGETYEGVVTIVNTDSPEREVRIYQTDYRFTCDGRYFYDEPGRNLRSNAQWIDFSPRTVIVPPRGTVDVSYTVTVPETADLVGTYWSVLMVEVAGTGAARSRPEKPETISLGISQVIRYGIQLVNHISDTGERRLGFLDTRVLRAGESRTLEVDLENAGERWLRPLVWAELYDDNGVFMGRFEGGTLRIYPGTSARYKMDLSDVPGG